jgi:putative ABC transport system substrate-binding protein
VKRRDFIAGLGGAAAWPLAARAQQRMTPVIGFLHSGSPESTAGLIAAFRKGLSEVGYVEGDNVAIEYRWAYNEPGRLPELATDLVRRGVSAISTVSSTSAAVAAKAATSTTPIIFGISGDPVEVGLVAALNRPGGNVTGINDMSAKLAAKRLGLLHELLPAAARFAILVNRNNPNFEFEIIDAQSAAAEIGGQVDVIYAANSGDIDMGFTNLIQKRTDALVVSPSTLFSIRRAQLVTLAARHAMPTIYDGREYVTAGGLMSYGPDNIDQARHVGIYTGRILKGGTPADFPVMRATKFDFIINLQTAKLLDLTIPETLLATADEVIQ